ncbi:tetracycline resistance MFS efflux pump [Chryseobacterium contaminans]|uniref:MFS transporter, DHA1 family, tetracycline resistance protein n=2 Tax=Chryseobacterium contaminans TaxID=1423959 RepID=A0A1M6VDR0_9FLAO|nr:TCR/Tet family MFS transporter [Chryseobacterium contaminans]OCA71107.1 tetracycline resistance MFS efflux pump [Chryseobacterium contaminans]SHK79504.1 MFS transporter, DHA1 family, tetracycline resistance protein [Chryseobacterium contaminans]
MPGKKEHALIFIYITVLIDIIGIGIIIPVLPTLITKLSNTDNISVTAQYIGWFISVYALMQFLFAPVLGGLSDRYGRRPVLLCSLLGLGVDYLILALAPDIAWLFVGRVINGIMGSSMTTAAAYISDISTPEKRGQYFGMMSAVAGIGMIIGPIIGGVLGQYGERIPFYAAAGLSLLNLIYGFFALPESLSKDKRRPFSWKTANPIGVMRSLNKEILAPAFIVAFILIALAGHSVQSSWSVYVMDKFKWKEDMIGYSMGLLGLLTVVFQGGLIGLFINKLGQKKSAIIFLAFFCVSMLLFGVASKGWMMFMVIAMYALGGMASPILQAMISAKIPDNKQGLLQGGLTSILSLSSIVGPLLMTWIFAYFTSPQSPIFYSGAPFVLGAVLAAIGSLCIYVAMKKNN